MSNKIQYNKINKRLQKEKDQARLRYSLLVGR